MEIAKDPNRKVEEELESSLRLLVEVSNDLRLKQEIYRIAKTCSDAIRAGNKIMLIGNGGSAGDCQHIAGELMSRLQFDRPSMPAISLTVDTSVITAIANDYGYDQIFLRQIDGLGRKGDVLFAYSTSGKSKNVLAALDYAKSNGIINVGFTGTNGAATMADKCSHIIVVPSLNTPKIQELHLIIGHIVCGLIEQDVYGVGH